MDNTTRRGSTRERIEKRKRRREAMVVLRDEASSSLSRVSVPKAPRVSPDRLQRWGSIARDVLWHLMHRTMALRLGIIGTVLLVGLFMVTSVLATDIPPNVWALGQPIGHMSRAEAADALFRAWHEETRIRVLLEEDIFAELPPDDVGLMLDIDAMVEEASTVGLSGIPFGVNIAPVVRLNYGTAENYLLGIVNDVYIPPYEAGYALDNGQLIGVQGRPSRELDISGTLDAMQASPLRVLNNGELTLLTTSALPDVMDPMPFLADARDFLDNAFTLVGYDPFSNAYEPWTTTRDQMVNWLAAGYSSLILREEPFERFVDAINETLRTPTDARYLNEVEAIESVNQALVNGASEAIVRVRYTSTEYTVEYGDYGYRIADKTGLPYGLIEEANPDVEWEALSVGDVVRVPSRDRVLPIEPLAHKRIVVDLDEQWLVAFENGDIVFSWPISSGQPSAPTYTGIFQILSHTPVAYGSSFSLCNASGTSCGQWEMNWFMGIYEVVPGLMNGFHGAVLLPDGTYLGGGGVRYPSTFGCVMSEDESARQLYEWAELGTVVEIIDREFQPQSDLGRVAQSHIRTVAY